MFRQEPATNHTRQVSTTVASSDHNESMDDDHFLFRSLFRMLISFSTKILKHFLLHKLIIPLSGCVIGGGIPYLFIENPSSSKRRTFLKSVCVVSGALLGFGISNLLCSMYMGLQTWKRVSRWLKLDFHEDFLPTTHIIKH
ncbi:hypothetical protein C9374_013253 [Naegleria lovaniensis]|uniref:Uncharacterized protein n=1 Tax=Naegleria lovaniensis TaxID=51637 RepID=A0AA88GZ01_NAELO|nr:uncharacterized protein C9374_013253 [Naegleria lovaniensis]KAG2391768.1 hypothetical protein C9374_013253 [Naegleria lovaniensis]